MMSMRVRSNSEGLAARIVLIILYVALLAGRYSLSPLVPSLGGVDMRWVLLGLLLACFGLWVLANNPQRIAGSTSGYSLLASLWIWWLIFSTSWAPHGATVDSDLMDLFFMLCWIMLIGAIAPRLPDRAFSTLWNVIVIVAVLYLIAGFASGNVTRMAAFGGGPNVFVRVMIMGGVAALAISLRRERLLPLVLVPAFAIGALASGSRGGVIAGILVGVAALVVLSLRVGVSRVLVVSAALTGGGLLVLNFVGEGRRNYLYQRFVVQSIDNRYASMRDVLFEKAFLMFQEAPLIGQGIGSFRLETDRYAHNLVLSVAAETGVIGLTLLLIPIAVFIVRSARSINRVTVLAASFCAVAILVSSMFSGDYYDSRFMWFFMVIAVQVSGRTEEGESAEEPPKVREITS